MFFVGLVESRFFAVSNKCGFLHFRKISLKKRLNYNNVRGFALSIVSPVVCIIPFHDKPLQLTMYYLNVELEATPLQNSPENCVSSYS